MPLSDPSALPCLSEDSNNINVVIETPKGSRNKFAFDEKQKIFRLKKFCRLGWHSLMISGLYLPRGPTTATRWTLLMSFDASRKNYYWSVELSKAIAQVEKYLYEIQRHSDTFKVELHTAKGIDINVVRPRGTSLLASAPTSQATKRDTTFAF